MRWKLGVICVCFFSFLFGGEEIRGAEDFAKEIRLEELEKRLLNLFNHGMTSGEDALRFWGKIVILVDEYLIEVDKRDLVLELYGTVEGFIQEILESEEMHEAMVRCLTRGSEQFFAWGDRVLFGK